MGTALLHRGPDSGGSHERGDVGLAVRRLRVIDLVTGDQPVRSACSGAVIVYNGELYNYLELRAILEARGHRFITDSDTEVALHWYEEHGISGLSELDGMFAFAIDDPTTNRLVLARDQFGIKPLYFAQPAPSTLIFGSEPKALFASGLVSRSVDSQAVGDYLTSGHSLGDRTIYAGVRKVRPGHALTFSQGQSRFTRYYDLVDRAQRWPADAPMPVDEIAALLADAVRRNMLADVPIGAFLSGGIDSSVVTALMRQHSASLHTYSVGFGEENDELPDAQAVSNLLGTIHTSITVTSEDAARAVGQLARIYDEPFADAAAIPTYLMAQRAREDVTVVLTGEGGDEVFGGYRRYVAEQLHRPYAVIPQQLRALAAGTNIERIPQLRRAGRALRALAEDERSARYATWTETFSSRERAALLGTLGTMDGLGSTDALGGSQPPRVQDDVTAFMLHELSNWMVDTYLEKVDKATMAASLEARVPLLDRRLVEALALAPRAWKIRGNRTKILLRAIASRSLPAQTTKKPKRGFGPPIGTWLRTTLRQAVDEMCDTSAPIAAFVDSAAVRTIVDGSRRGEWRDSQVWTLLILEQWARAQEAA